MVRPDDITGFLDNSWFESLAGLGSWISTILISAVLLGIIWLTWQIIDHKLKVTYFPIHGADPSDLKGVTSLTGLSDIPGIIIGMPKTDKGKDIKEKGISKFSLFKCRKKIPPVEYSKRYPEGIWMLRINKQEFIPIERPTLQDTINLKMPEPDMDLWQESAEADIRRRTQDEDMMKKQLYAMIAIIIGAFVLAGLIIWLSMSFAGNSIDSVLMEVKPMTSALQGLSNPQGPG